MKGTGLEHMSRWRRAVVLALGVPGTLFAVANPFVWPSDGSYLLATVVGASALAVVAEWWLTPRLEGNPRALGVFVDLLPTAVIITAIALWGAAIGWMRWVLLIVVLVLTWLFYVHRVYGPEAPS